MYERHQNNFPKRYKAKTPDAETIHDITLESCSNIPNS